MWCAFGGGMSWAVYIFCMLIMGAGLYTSLFFASTAVVALAEILARRIKTPVTVLMVPMIIPLIPGGTLYYAMSYLLESRYELFAQEARSLTLQVFAIALGIIITTSLSRAVFTEMCIRDRRRPLRQRPTTSGRTEARPQRPPYGALNGQKSQWCPASPGH